jgi:hypothetical protein
LLELALVATRVLDAALAVPPLFTAAVSACRLARVARPAPRALFARAAGLRAAGFLAADFLVAGFLPAAFVRARAFVFFAFIVAASEMRASEDARDA